MASGTEVQRGVGTMIAGAIICALVMSFFFVPPVAAQPLCGPASVKYIVRSQNGTTLTTAELQTVRAQLPEEIGGAEVVVEPSIPSLWFWSYRTCVMDLQNAANEANYREQFGNLDLELRFQIMTDNGILRAASVEAVRNGLASLRAANQP
ncbi:MAG TPA: hypothetical protein VKK06_15845 [Terriglobia bacterium]|nr:hypothetical protein [Terriglobia bacterium]